MLTIDFCGALQLVGTPAPFLHSVRALSGAQREARGFGADQNALPDPSSQIANQWTIG